MDQNETLDEFRRQVRRLAEHQIQPHAAAVDEDARLPVEAIAAFQSMGLCGLAFPERLGGSKGAARRLFDAGGVEFEQNQGRHRSDYLRFRP